MARKKLQRCWHVVLPRGLTVVLAGSLAGAFVIDRADAQFQSSQTGMTFNNPGSAYLADALMNRMHERHQRADRQERAARLRAPATTTFKPGERAILGQFSAEKRSQALRALQECDKVYVETMSRTRVAHPAPLNDVASAAAFHLAIAHHVYWNGQPQAPPEAEAEHLEALRTKLREGLIAQGALVGKDDVQKQSIGDGFVLSACLNLLQYTRGKKTGDETSVKQARDQASALLRRAGLSPQSLRFQPDGSIATVR